jgi:hypothetical protein
MEIFRILIRVRARIPHNEGIYSSYFNFQQQPSFVKVTLEECTQYGKNLSTNEKSIALEQFVTGSKLFECPSVILH